MMSVKKVRVDKAGKIHVGQFIIVPLESGAIRIQNSPATGLGKLTLSQRSDAVDLFFVSQSTGPIVHPLTGQLID